MWQTTIPQCAWTSESVRYGIVALAACYEGIRSGYDRASLVLTKTNKAIEAFRKEPANDDVALIMCRILASLAQSQEDWKTAASHMAWGARILRQLSQNTCPASSIAKIVAPTYMNVLTESEELLAVQRDLTPQQRQIWVELIQFRAKYRTYYVNWIAYLWPKASRSLKAHLLTAWSTLNHAISSALYPQLVLFTPDDPVVPIGQIEQELRRRCQIYPIDELSAFSDAVLSGIDDYLKQDQCEQDLDKDLEEKFRVCIENYMVQASIFEPLMTAGTYWTNNPEPKCSVELRMRQYTDAGAIPTAFPDAEMHEASNEKQNFYLEHVCPYRSGFVPYGDDCCPIYMLKNRRSKLSVFGDRP